MTGKVLFCATVDYHFKAFHLPFMKWFQEQGWEVHVAARGDLNLPYTDKKFDIPMQRSPFSFQNARAFKELKIIIDNNNYKIIHCHTPIGGLLARLASFKARKKGTRVIYTAHGFHFYEGGPIMNWLLYYPVERILALNTDCLITINEKDYSIAVSHGFSAGRIAHVHGVGVNTEKFKPVSEEEKMRLRNKHGYDPEHFMLFYAAELNKNKNQYLLIKAIANLSKKIPNIKLLLAGSGPFEDEYRTFAVREGVHKKVDFLGQRNDINELLQMSDVAVASSFREGLPVNLIEAMACRLPLVASSNRGHSELITDGVNGYVISDDDHISFSEKLYAIYKNPGLRMNMGNESVKSVARYKLTRVSAEMSKIYSQYMY